MKFQKAFTVLPALCGLLLTVSAQALVLEPSPERTALLVEVFGTRVAHGLIDLKQERFKGAIDYAMLLARGVKAHQLTVQEAQDKLLKTLQDLDRGAQLASVPDPEFEVVGLMPVGESEAGRGEPGAGQAQVALNLNTAPTPEAQADESDKAPEPALEADKTAESAPAEGEKVAAAPAVIEPVLEDPSAPAAKDSETNKADDAALDRQDEAEDRGVSSIGG